MRFKPTELRHLLFNLADHATATALPFAKLAWDGMMGSYNQSTSVSSINLGGISDKGHRGLNRECLRNLMGDFLLMCAYAMAGSVVSNLASSSDFMAYVCMEHVKERS